MKSLLIRRFITSALLIVFVFPLISNAASMTSGSYSIERDSMNFGGGNSISTSYGLESTGGEVGTGDLSGTNYNAAAGYQQKDIAILGTPDPSPSTQSGGSSGGRSRLLPVNIINFTATPIGNSIHLNWQYPLIHDIQSVKIVRSTLFFPTSVDEGEVIFEGNTNSVIDHHVVTGKNYYYAIFARNSLGLYSSGVLSQAYIVPKDSAISNEDEVIFNPENPFEYIPESGILDPIINALTLSDFNFIQDGIEIEHGGDIIAIDGKKNVTIMLAYNKVPEVLKTIAINLADPKDSSKTFTFLLRVNENKTAYEATIGALNIGGYYKLHAVVLDYKNQSMKQIQGQLKVFNFSAFESILKNNLISHNLKITIFSFLILVFIFYRKRKFAAFMGMLIAFAFVVSFALYIQISHAAINKQINYQGKLVNTLGDAVPDGTYAMEFDLYTASSGGSLVWTETRTGVNEVTVTDGLFSVMLGSVSALTSVDFNQTLYLGVNIESDGEMSPRKIIGAVPTAFVADTLDGLDSTQFLRSDTGSATSGYFIATTSTSSTFPYASTTAISATTICITTDCRTSWPSEGDGVFPFTTTTFGATTANATSTLIGFTNGIYSLASSTIGNGNQTGGLTISGGATTTRNAYFGGNIGIGTTSPYGRLSIEPMSLTAPALLIGTSSGSSGIILQKWETAYGSSEFTVDGGYPTLFVNSSPSSINYAGRDNTANGNFTHLIGSAFFSGSIGNYVGFANNVAASFWNPTAPTGAGTTYSPINWYVGGGEVNSYHKSAEISPISEGASDTASSPTSLVFKTNAGSGAYSTLVERLRIGYNGNIGIGTTSPYAKLSVVGQVVGAYFTATTSTSSTFPYASTTAISATTICITTDCRTSWPTGGSSAFPFDPTTFGATTANATSTLIGFNAGLYSLASSTIGAGGQTTGLTISGGATTTGNAYFAGNVGVRTTTPTQKLTVGGGYALFDNTYGIKMKDSAGTERDILTFSSADNISLTGRAGVSDFYIIGSSNFAFKSSGYLGIGDATPQNKLSVVGGMNIYSAAGGTFDTAAPSNGLIVEGNVGVGTTSPYSILSISNNRLTTANTPLFTIASTTNGTATTTVMTVTAGSQVVIGKSSPTSSFDLTLGRNGTIGGGTFGGTRLDLSGGTASLTGNNGVQLGTNFNVFLVAASGNYFGQVGLNTTTNMSSLSVRAVPDGTISGTTVANNTTTITGASTVYTTQLAVGDRVALSSSPTTYATVLSVSSNTSMTVSSAIGDGTSQTILVKKSIANFADTNGLSRFFINDEGNIGIGTTSPYAKLSVAGQIVGAYFTATTTTASTFPYASTTALSASTICITTDCRTSWPSSSGSAFPYTTTTFGATTANATSTLIGFTNGIYSLASSTIGNGTATGGLTISGGATTTGNAYFGGNIGIGTTSPYAKLSISGTANQANPYFSISTSTNGTPFFSIASSTGFTLDGGVGNPMHKGSIVNGAGGAVMDGPQSVFVSGDYAYVVSYFSNALEIIDISIPSAPVHKGSLANGVGGALLYTPVSVFVSGKYAYIASASDQALEIVDVSNPAAPVHKGSLVNGVGGALLSNPRSVFVSGNYAYVTSYGNNALEIVDISNPSAPVHKGSISNGAGGALLNGPYSVFVSGNYAYVAVLNSDALEIIDISNPSAPVHKGSLVNGAGGALLDGSSSVFVSGNYAYVASYSSDVLEIIDVSNPGSPVHKGSLANGAGGALLSQPQSVFVSGNYAYVVSQISDSVEIVDISNPAAPFHKGSLVNGVGGALLDSPNSVFVSGNYAYVTSVLTDSLEIIDVGSGNIANIAIGNTNIGTLQVSNFAQFNQNVLVNSSLNVGQNGLFGGSLAISGYSSTTASNTNYAALLIGNGNIAIGTTTPTSRLTIAATSSLSNTTLLSVHATPSAGATTTAFTVLSNANVGIGTTTPNWKLSVSGIGSFDDYVRASYFTATSTTASTFPYASTTALTVSGTAYMPGSGIWNASGNVGIGTTSPYAKLSVAGLGVFDNIFATSTTATSTFAGGLNVGNGGLVYDFSTGITSIASIETGAFNFETNAGIVSWADMPITSDASSGTVESYSAQLNGTSVLTVYGESDGANGVQNTRVGIGTTTPGATLDVVGALCVDDATPTCGNAARTAGTIYAVATAITGIDLAETYPTKDLTLEAGDVVELDPNNPVYVKKAQGRNKILGVVSTAPGVLLGGYGIETFGGDVKVPIALSGRVPVKVSIFGGDISVGDYLTVGSDGLVQKANQNGYVIGRALEPFTASSTETTIQVFVQNSFHFIAGQFVATPDGNIGIGTDAPTHKLEVVGDIFADSYKTKIDGEEVDLAVLTTSALTAVTEQKIILDDLQARVTTLEDLFHQSTTTITQDTTASTTMEVITYHLTSFGAQVIDGILHVKNLFADKVTTKELCLEEICITKEELKALLQANAISTPTASPTSVIITTSPSIPPTEDATTTPPVSTTIPIVETVSEPVIEVTPPEPEPEPTPVAEPEVETPAPAPEV